MGAYVVKCLLMNVYQIIIYFSVLFSESSFLPLSCNLLRKFYLNGLHKPGDLILGGLFEIHYSSVFPEQAFTAAPHQISCQG